MQSRCGISVLAAMVMAASLFPNLLGQRRPRVQPAEGVPAYFQAFASHDQAGEIARVVLRNGLTVLVEEHPNEPLVSIVTRVRMPEGPGESEAVGATVAHCLEGGFLRDLFSLGGVGTVSADAEATLFSGTIPAENLRKGLELNARLLVQPHEFSAEEVAFSATVLGQRRAARQAGPRTQALGELAQLLETASEAPPEAVSLDQARAAYARDYRPEKIILAISGAVRREQVLRQIVELLAGWRPAAAEQPAEAASQVAGAGEPVSPTARLLRYRNRRGEYPTPFLLVGFPVGESRDPDFEAVELVRYLTGVGGGALLHLPIESETGAAPYDFEATTERLGGRNVVVFDAVVRPGNFDRAEARLLALLSTLATQSVPTALLNRAKAMMVSDFYRSQETLIGRTTALARAEGEGDFRRRDGFPQRVAAISSAALQSVVQRYFPATAPAVAEFQPTDAEVRTFTAESFAEAMTILISANQRAQIGLLDLFAGNEEVSPFQARAFTPDYSETALKRSSILRGPEIYLRERHSVPLVHVGFFFPGGRVEEDPETVGRTALLVESLLANLARQHAGGRITALEGLGGRFSVVDDVDFFGFEAVFLSPEIASATLDLVDFLRQAELEARDVEAAKLHLRRAGVLDVEDPSEALRRRARSLLYGSHPYGRDWRDQPGSLDRLEFGAVQKAHAEALKGVHPYLVVTGDIQGTSFLEGATTLLSNSHFRVTQPIRRKVEVNLQEAKARAPLQVEAPGTTLLIFPGPASGENYVEMLDMAQRLLCGAGSPLVDRLRSESRWAERISLSLEPHLGGGAIMLQVEGPDDGRAQATAAVLTRLKSFSGDAVPAARFYETMVGTITEHYLRQEDPDRFVRDTMRAVLAGEKAEYAANYLMNLKVMRAGEVELALERYLGRSE